MRFILKAYTRSQILIQFDFTTPPVHGSDGGVSSTVAIPHSLSWTQAGRRRRETGHTHTHTQPHRHVHRDADGEPPGGLGDAGFCGSEAAEEAETSHPVPA